MENVSPHDASRAEKLLRHKKYNEFILRIIGGRKDEDANPHLQNTTFVLGPLSTDCVKHTALQISPQHLTSHPHKKKRGDENTREYKSN